ncbi:hypothetical protein AA313_de0205925 [Arthrobotrys entomopaga]|nr:hypothetical protein AA313_de0205925 [Arthrobotrys entomopaga]
MHAWTDPQETPREPVGAAAGTVSTSRKRRLSPTCDRDSVQLLRPTRTPGSSEDRTTRNSDAHSTSSPNISIGDTMAIGNIGNSRYQLVACGCNSHGQLDYHSDRGIVPDTSAAPLSGDSGTSGSAAEENVAAATVTLAHAARREPSLFTTLDTPTVIMTASNSMRILYVGVNSICVERDGRLYLRGLLPTLTPFNPEKLPELPVSLPENIETRDIKMAFGTRWALIGIILFDGSVYTFTLEDWCFIKLPALDNVIDIQINRLSELCLLCRVSEYETNRVIKIFRPIESITNNLHNPTLQSFTTNNIQAILTFDLSSITSPTGSSEHEFFTDVAATSTGFIALTSHGNVYTYGDARFNSLGRPPGATISSTTDTEQNSNNDELTRLDGKGWGQVTALDGIYITRIAANPGGHVQFALSRDGTGYAWGGDGTENIGITFQEGEEVGIVDIYDPGTGEPVEFEDMAVGEDHAVMVEGGRRGVWVSGASDLGQTGFGREYRCLPAALGIDEEIKARGRVWRRWDRDDVFTNYAGRGGIVQAECGFGCTLVIMEYILNQP